MITALNTKTPPSILVDNYVPGLEPLLKIELDREFNFRLMIMNTKVAESLKDGKKPKDDYYLSEKQKKRIEDRVPEGTKVVW